MLTPLDPDPDGWAIICDFDGTVTPFDVTDAVLERFADPAWREVEADWRQGRISARACMETQVGLIKVRPSELNEFLDDVPLTEGFKDFVRLAKGNSIPLTIVSDGMDYAIRRILTRHSLDFLPVIANRLLPAADFAYRLEFPHSAPDCSSGVCKCAVARSPSGTGVGKTLLVGDGKSDCCLADKADFILARAGQELERHCADAKRQYLPYENFFTVAAALERHIRAF